MYHQTQVIGNVGKAPEMRYTPSGTAVTNFSLAVNEQFKTANGEQVKRTIWYRVTTFGKQAEVVNQYVKKGMLVFVSGRMTADPDTGGPKIWNKQDGTPAASFELNAHEVKFLSRVNDEAHSDPATADEEPMPF
jgi:single-strand DNA-binding protein